MVRGLGQDVLPSCFSGGDLQLVSWFVYVEQSDFPSALLHKLAGLAMFLLYADTMTNASTELKKLDLLFE